VDFVASEAILASDSALAPGKAGHHDPLELRESMCLVEMQHTSPRATLSELEERERSEEE